MAKLSFKDMIFKVLRKDEDAVEGVIPNTQSEKQKLYDKYIKMGKHPDAAAELVAAAVSEDAQFRRGPRKKLPGKLGKALSKFTVKFAYKSNDKIAVATYDKMSDAMKFINDVKSKGGKAILTTEDAPANATGTAVPGTGDDSSTVVVRKKKRLQSKLMKRMGITETINKTIPDLEYPKDEIRERVNQLKAYALGEAFTSQQIKQAYGIANDPRYKGGNYSGAVRAIEKLAKGLSQHPDVQKVLKRTNETVGVSFQLPKGNHRRYVFKTQSDANKYANAVKKKGGVVDKVINVLSKNIDDINQQLKSLGEELSEGAAVPKDKDTKQPKKYVSGLSDKDKKAHDKHLEKGSKKADDDKSAYKQSPADKKAKTKPSKYTDKFKKMYGEGRLDEKIKGLETKAKKTGMPYGILKKVYDRGMAAWKGGHRPGTTPQQWAFARVNSFTTKSPGTWGKADSDLAKQVRGS